MDRLVDGLGNDVLLLLVKTTVISENFPVPEAVASELDIATVMCPLLEPSSTIGGTEVVAIAVGVWVSRAFISPADDDRTHVDSKTRRATQVPGILLKLKLTVCPGVIMIVNPSRSPDLKITGLLVVSD